jgi:hypothetical protein
MHPEAIPWARLVHFEGRASDIPGLLSALGGPGHVEAERQLLRRVEHQDGVIQCTPFVVLALRELLGSRAVRDPDAVLEILRRVARSARLQADAFGGGELLDLEALSAERFLLPPVDDEREDEALLEDWDPSLAELHSWAIWSERLALAALRGD